MVSGTKNTSSRIGFIALALASVAISAPARAQQDDPTTTAFVAACKQAVTFPGYARTWFGMGAATGIMRIRTLDQAVQARKDALRSGVDELTRTMQQVQQAIDRLEESRRRTPNDKFSPIEEECARRYVAYLQSLDAPSWEIARKAAADETAAKLAQQQQFLQAQQQAQDAAAAETARQQKEAAIAAAQAEVAAAQRAAQQQADAETRENEQRFAREAAAKAGKELADEQRRIAERLPGCTDDQVLEMVKGAVAASPAGHALGLRVVDIQNPRETGVGGSTPKRSCFAEMMTTAGRSWGPYTISWASGGQDHVLVEVQLSQ